jgi:hypothetical protein
MIRSCSFLVLCLALSGCHLFGGPVLDPIATASGRPSNVAALVSVTREGAAVQGLALSSFQIEENGQRIDPTATGARLLEPGMVASFHTVLLLDLGHGNSEPRRKELARAAASFVRQVQKGQSVTVLGFDGSPTVRTLGEFGLDPAGSAPEQLDTITAVLPTDRSRNLRGAVVRALDLLDARLGNSQRPVKLGTLVVFSRGPDIAGRVAQNVFEQRLSETGYQSVFVGVTGDVSDDAEPRLAKNGKLLAQSEGTLPIAFEETASLVNGFIGQYYLLSYCSPSRAGVRELTVTVAVAAPEGKDETDSFSAEFNSDGFGPGCNASRPPRFITTRPAARTTPSTAPTSTTPNKPTTDSTDDPNVVPPPNKSYYAP